MALATMALVGAAALAAPSPVLEFSTWIGGGQGDAAQALAVDPAGSLYITGYTNSVDFPVVSALQPAAGGDSDTAGDPGLTIPLPPGALWHYRVAAASCAGEGPR